MTSERRENHRLPIKGSSVQGAMMQGQVLNLSLNGLAIETTDGLHIGKKHRLRMKLESRILVLEATVRWCRLKRIHPKLDGDLVPIYRAGLEIELPPSSSPRTIGPNWICRPSM